MEINFKLWKQIQKSKQFFEVLEKLSSYQFDFSSNFAILTLLIFDLLLLTEYDVISNKKAK